MADVQANIVLVTTGGDESAAEIQKASAAIQSVTTASSGMQAQFQQRFQHIGLMLFAGDALRASGLGAETRMVVNSLNMALTAGGSAFGAAAMPALLFVSALAAVALAAEKVISKHKDEAAALAKLAEQQTKSYQNYNDEAKSLTAMAAAGGNLTPAMLALLAADKQVAEDMKGNLLATQEKEIAALEKQRAGLELQQSLHNAWAQAVGVATKALHLLVSEFQIFFPVLSAVGEGINTVKNYLSSMLSSVGQHVTLTGALKQKYDELTASINKVKAEHSAMATGTVLDLKAMSQASEDHKNAVIQATHDEMDARKRAQDQEDAHELSIMDYHVQKFIEGQQKQVEEHNKSLQQMEKQAEVIFNRIGGDIGNAFAQSIVAGKSFTAELSDAFRKMEEQIISYLMQIIVKQMLLYTWQQITGTVGSGNIMGGTGGGSFFGGFATGGTRMVDQPTMFLAGEAGPEMASFTPMGSPGGADAGSVGTVNISLNVDHINGNDPAGTLQMLSDEVRRETATARQFAATVAGVAARYPRQAY